MFTMNTYSMQPAVTAHYSARTHTASARSSCLADAYRRPVNQRDEPRSETNSSRIPSLLLQQKCSSADSGAAASLLAHYW